MMDYDLEDAKADIQRLRNDVDRLMSGSMLESASVDRGRVRIGDAEFRVDGDGLFSLVGRFNQSGEYVMYDGASFEIREGGTVDLDGLFRILSGGRLTLQGVLDILSGGALNVRSGGGVNVLNGGTIEVAGGVIQVNGPVPVRLTRKTVLGVDMAGINFGTGGTFIGGRDFGGKPGIMIIAGEQGISINEDGVSVIGVEQGNAASLLGVTSSGRLVRTTGTGGGGEDPDPEPGDGVFRWPFPLSLVTDEFRPPHRPTHDGMDFGMGIANTEGYPILPAGAGTVSRILAEGQGHGWGNGVVVDHGTVDGDSLRTLYAHMFQPPYVSLGQQISSSTTLGGIGNTGNSYGNHLHYETHVNGVPINPRTFHATYGS